MTLPAGPPRRQQLVCKTCGLILWRDLRLGVKPSRIISNHRFEQKCDTVTIVVWRTDDGRPTAPAIELADTPEQLTLLGIDEDTP